jgi:hypothetical protein
MRGEISASIVRRMEMLNSTHGWNPKRSRLWFSLQNSDDQDSSRTDVDPVEMSIAYPGYRRCDPGCFAHSGLRYP